MRWGLIGAGDIVRKRVGEALRDGRGCELVAVSRARADLLEAFAREAGARRWHADWRDLVRDPDIDAVYVATPVDLHAEQTIAAAEAGKHVLCARARRAACRGAGVERARSGTAAALLRFARGARLRRRVASPYGRAPRRNVIARGASALRSFVDASTLMRPW